MQSLSGMRRRIETYLEQNAPGVTFEISEQYKGGWFGTKFRADSAGFLISYKPKQSSIARVPVAEVGILLRLPENPLLKKQDPYFAEALTIKGEDKKYFAVYTPDRDKQNGDRLFSESKLVKVAKGESVHS